MKNTPISLLLANLSDIYLAGVSNLLLKVHRPLFQVVNSTSLDPLLQVVRESRPHLLLVGLPRKGVDVEGTIIGSIEETVIKIREQFPEVIIAVFAIPGIEEYREAIAIAKRTGVEIVLSLEMESRELVKRLEQLFVQKAKSYKQRLRDLTVGDGRGYELFAEEVLPFLFKPHFGRFRSQVRRGVGDQRDFICKNEGHHSLCKTILKDHRARYVVFEIKNEAIPKVEHLRQLAAFLTPATGSFGIVLARQPPNRPQVLYGHLGDLFNRDGKMLIVLYDEDVLEMLDMRIRLSEPIDYLEERYDHYRMRT
jgi:hypothetical protein